MAIPLKYVGPSAPRATLAAGIEPAAWRPEGEGPAVGDCGAPCQSKSSHPTSTSSNPANLLGHSTSKRFDKALSVTLNSVMFRSSGQDLTTAGTYIEMTSRLLEPTLLALAALAVRGRIKR